MKQSTYRDGKYYRNLKARVFEYLGGRCVECGTTDDLQIDHKDPAKKSFNITKCYNKTWDVLVVEIDKCQLLCEPHHKAKHAPRHGTISMYRNRRCRCDDCRGVWNRRTQAWKENAKLRGSLNGKRIGSGPIPEGSSPSPAASIA